MFVLHPYFVQNKYVPHTNNSPLQRTDNAPGGRTPQFENLCYTDTSILINGRINSPGQKQKIQWATVNT
jgi:hypothetical protein